MEELETDRTCDQSYRGELEQFLTDHLDDLSGFLSRAFQDSRRADHQDLVQATVLYVLKHRNEFRYGGSDGFRNWLLTKGHRVAIDLWRHDHAARRDMRRESQNSPSAHAENLRDSLTPSRHAARNEMLLRLNECVDRLPTKDRHLVDLYFEQQLTIAEISRLTDRPYARVRRELSQLVQQIRRSVEA